MNGVILAAGEGTRLRPLTETTPKPLLEVDGQPILTYCLETLRELDISEAVIVVGYKHEQIIEHYGDSYKDLAITYVHQHDRTGLAHAVLAAAEAIESDFLLLNGDNIYSGNIDEALTAHRQTAAELTMLVDTVPADVATTGAVCKLDDSGAVTGLVEKPETPPSRVVPMAVYVLPPAIFHACRLIKPSSRGEYELAAAIDLLLHAGYEVQTVPFEGWKLNINTEADLERATARLSGQST